MSRTQTATAGTTNITESVTTAVAEAEGVDPIDLSVPLYDVIDPDALNNLFAPMQNDSRGDGRVVFSYDGHQVTVFSDGSVTVEERDGRRL